MLPEKAALRPLPDGLPTPYYAPYYPGPTPCYPGRSKCPCICTLRAFPLLSHLVNGNVCLARQLRTTVVKEGPSRKPQRDHYELDS